MTKNPFVIIQIIFGELSRDQAAAGVLRVIAFYFWKYFAQGCGQSDERLVLLRREIVLNEVRVLDVSSHQVLASGPPDKIVRPLTAIAEAGGTADGRAVALELVRHGGQRR